MAHIIARNVVLLDNSGQEIKELKPGQVAKVRIQTVSKHTIKNDEISNTINNNKQGD